MFVFCRIWKWTLQLSPSRSIEESFLSPSIFNMLLMDQIFSTKILEFINIFYFHQWNSNILDQFHRQYWVCAIFLFHSIIFFMMLIITFIISIYTIFNRFKEASLQHSFYLINYSAKQLNRGTQYRRLQSPPSPISLQISLRSKKLNWTQPRRSRSKRLIRQTGGTEWRCWRPFGKDHRCSSAFGTKSRRYSRSSDFFAHKLR